MRDFEFYSNDFCKKMRVSDYLKRLLCLVIDEVENFNGKRPFGNSGWLYDIYSDMIKLKLVDGKMDDHGYVEELDCKKADELLMELIMGLE